MRPSRALSIAVFLIAAASLAGCAASNTARAPASAAARPAGGAGGAAGAGAAASADKPMQDWKKVTKDAEKIPGYLTLWKKRENLYLELPKEMLDVPVLGIFSFGRGIGDHGIFGGMPLNDRLLAFERHGDRILVLEKNVRFLAPDASPIARARDLSVGHSVLASLKIESEHDSSKAVLVDFAPFLVSDLSDLSEYLRQTLEKPVRFDKERSAMGTIKNFPENTEIEALLTYTPNDRNNLTLESVPDSRYVPITVHYSFSKLPAVPMKPRLADERVGYFLTARKDFSRDDQENFWLRYVERWRLEKKDPNAALSEPVKPITFYIDRTVPKEYRPWVKEGIEKWQKSFEKAGFKNAIVAVEAPEDDPNWDAEDVRYSTIRWITSHGVTFNAIGPSRSDPRSGELLDADVLIEANAILGYRNWWRRYAGPNPVADAMANPLDALKHLPGRSLDRMCFDASAAADGAALMHMGLMADGALAPGTPVPDEFLKPLVVRLVLHEVGHTLGLRHNFRASTATPNDKLHDVAWTQEHGLMASVMDYVTPNIALDRSKQGEYFIGTTGTYDDWAIRYGYTPSGTDDLMADHAFAKKIADEAAAAGHEYSTDEDTYPAQAMDPRTAVRDLGGDPLSWAKDRATYVSSLWRKPEFESRIVGPNGEYPVLRRAMDTLLGEYGATLQLAVKYVGGQYHDRARRGQPGAVDPLRPVAAAKQREALDFLARRAFAHDAFDVHPALLGRLMQDRWSHWGVPNPFAPTLRVDYDLNDKVFFVQGALLNGLTNPVLLSRLREAEKTSPDAFRMSEHFARLTTMLWGEVGEGNAAFRALGGPHTRRQIQRAYVDRLAASLVTPPAGLPDDARALARLQLTRIDQRCARALASGGLSDEVQSHLLESRARIERALDAERSVPNPTPANPLGDAVTRPSGE